MKTLLIAVLLALSIGGCARAVDVKTAPGFVELDNQEPQYAYRAMSPEGVVVGVRVIAVDEKGDLGFWTRAVTLRMRQLNGYALLTSADVASSEGTKGTELRFGHDEDGKPFLYRVQIYVAKGKLYIVEVGGAKEHMEKYQPSVDWMLKTLKV